MKRVINLAVAAGFAALACTGAAYGADGATAQQQRMTDCNKTAGEKGLKGDERKQFMSACLGGKGGDAKPAAGTTQQEKMKTCNAEAGKQNLKGDDRKKFMSSCLSGG